MAKLQEELETMRPLLEEAVKESVATMEQIAKDTVITLHKQNTSNDIHILNKQEFYFFLCFAGL